MGNHWLCQTKKDIVNSIWEHEDWSWGPRKKWCWTPENLTPLICQKLSIFSFLAFFSSFPCKMNEIKAKMMFHGQFQMGKNEKKKRKKRTANRVEHYEQFKRLKNGQEYKMMRHLRWELFSFSFSHLFSSWRLKCAKKDFQILISICSQMYGVYCLYASKGENRGNIFGRHSFSNQWPYSKTWLEFELLILDLQNYSRSSMAKTSIYPYQTLLIE